MTRLTVRNKIYKHDANVDKEFDNVYKKLNNIVVPDIDTSSLVGPEGPQGPAGPTGPEGPPGADGGGLAAVVDDLTPQLGGTLDLNGNDIDSTNFHWDESAGKLGINISPVTSAIIDVVGTSSATMIARNSTALSGTSGGGIYLMPTGTPSAADQRLAVINFAADLSGTVTAGAQIRAFSSQAWSAGNTGSWFQFMTTDTGSGTITPRWRIEQGGALRPEANNTYDIGLTGTRPATTYTTNLNLTNALDFTMGGTGSIGGSGTITRQIGLDNLTDVASATNEHVLTKDTATGNAVFKAAPSAGLTTRSYWVTNFAPRSTATYAARGTGLRYAAWGFATSHGLVTDLLVPYDWASGSLVFKLYWTRLTATSGNVDWRIILKEVASGADINTVAGETDVTDTIASPSQDVLLISTHTITYTPSAPGVQYKFLILKNAGSPSIGLIGIEVVYTSSI